MPVLSWAPRWPLAAASRREITEAALTSLSARATVMPSPNPPPSPDPLFSLGPASFLAHPPPTRPRCKLSQICQMMASSVRSLSRYPAKLVPVFFFFFLHAPSSRPPLIPPRNLHHKKKSLPPPPHPPPLLSHCRLFHLLLSLSLLSLCLILVCASACHIKGEPGVTEPQAWNINAANCVAVWEINPLKIAPYTSWTHHQSLIHIVIYRNSFLRPFVCCIMHRMFSLKTAAVRIVSSTTHLLKEFLYVRKECTT